MIKLFWSSFVRMLFLLLNKPVWLLLLCSVSLMSLVYSKGTIVDFPVAVVDLDHTQSSRELIRALDSSSKIQVIMYEGSLAAYNDINNRKIFAVITIPRNYEKRLLSGKAILVSTYGDASSRLASGLIQQDLVKLYQQVLVGYDTNIMLKSGFSKEQISYILSPIKNQTEALYNAGVSFAAITFPALLVMLLQHSFLVATSRTIITLNTLPQGKPPKIIFIGSICGIVPIWLFLSITLFGLWPWILGYRQLANILEILAMTFPLLFAVMGLSKFLTECIQRIEMIYLSIALMTTPIFYLSGMMWPIEAMPLWTQIVAKLLPSTWAVNMIAGVDQMGLSLSDNLYNIFMLFVLGIFYGTLGIVIAAIREKRIQTFFRQFHHGKNATTKDVTTEE